MGIGDRRLRSTIPRFVPAKMKKKLLPALVVGAFLVALCWVFPPFHILSAAQVRAKIQGDTFNPTNFVTEFWSQKLLPAAATAADAGKVVAAIAASPKKVREQFGHTMGISTTYCLFLRGSARVVAVGDESIGLSLKNEGDAVDISVPLGLLFGNAVRDGTGLIDSSSFPNAQDFNGISTELNRRVETQVLPELKKIAMVGKRVQFVGCVEVADEETDLKPLKLVPVSVKAE
jgi:predicted lipoprotein